MSTFSTPTQTYLYDNGDIRVISYKKINEGDTFEYLNMISVNKPVSAIAVAIKEERPSLGLFSGAPPTSYRIAIL